MNLYDYFQIKKIKMMTLIFDGIFLLPGQLINFAGLKIIYLLKLIFL